MNSNLIDATHSDTVQFPMRLQSRKHSFHARASVIDMLPLVVLWIRLHSPLVRRISLNDRSSPILPTNQMPQPFTAIPSISNDVLGMESTVDPTRLPQKRGGSSNISVVATHYVDSQRKLIGRIHQQGYPVSPSELATPVGVSLDNPASILVRRCPVTTVRPRLDIRSIHSHRLPIIRKHGVELPIELLKHTVDLRSHQPLRQLREEPGKCWLTRNPLFNAASSSDVRVVVKEPNQIRYGRLTQEVIHYVAMPEYLGVIPRPPTPSRASECFKKLTITLRNLGQHCSDLLNHRRQCKALTKCFNITVGHWEANPSFWFGSRRCSRTGDSVFPSAISNYDYNTIQRMALSRQFATNSCHLRY